ncbi:hypothetical protein [Stieleria mannarensis]|uniref:hypothetical protein n=1 Tax=Stieleria mannarensis TaxID=2755585 RepID=UPI001601B9EE|nr:hypothetical protein [Rhodopirellula sp. JC639]
MLIEVLAKFAGELEARNYRYALIGGLAASIRGRIRATEDIDLIVLCNLEEALNLVESLGDSGFSPLLENYEQVARSALLIPIIDRSSGIQLDLAIGLSGFEKDIVEVLGERFDWQYCLAAAKRLESAVDIDLVQQMKRLRPS